MPLFGEVGRIPHSKATLPTKGGGKKMLIWAISWVLLLVVVLNLPLPLPLVKFIAFYILYSPIFLVPLLAVLEDGTKEKKAW